MPEKESSRPRALAGAPVKQMSLERRDPSLAARPAGRADESRLLPLSIAGLVCFLLASALGGGAWYLFGTREGATPERAGRVTQLPPPSSAAPSPTPQTPAPALTAPAGELPVSGGEISLGGEGTSLPLRREFVKPFAIAETETTNQQYYDFVKATGHKAPEHWKDGEFPPGTANEPVTNVSWQDAVDYCRWLSEKMGVSVRLPTEAEWEWAARGKDNLKYPWGNDWKDQAADSTENEGRLRVVKSFPEGVSPVGAYDMAGNVWEWLADEVRDEEGNLKRKDDVTLRIIKGGSAHEPRTYINSTVRYEVPSNFKGSQWIGFRYIVLREPAGGDQPREGGEERRQ